jgi:hypothetical protein
MNTQKRSGKVMSMAFKRHDKKQEDVPYTRVNIAKVPKLVEDHNGYMQNMEA